MLSNLFELLGTQDRAKTSQDDLVEHAVMALTSLAALAVLSYAQDLAPLDVVVATR